jgi:hypothetical protein
VCSEGLRVARSIKKSPNQFGVPVAVSPSDLPSGADTGVGDDDVDAAELLESAFERSLDLVVVANVGLRQHRSAAGLLDQTFGLVQVCRCGARVGGRVDVAAEVESDDVGAFLGQCEGVGTELGMSMVAGERVPASLHHSAAAGSSSGSGPRSAASLSAWVTDFRPPAHIGRFRFSRTTETSVNLVKRSLSGAGVEHLVDVG